MTPIIFKEIIDITRPMMVRISVIVHAQDFPFSNPQDIIKQGIAIPTKIAVTRLPPIASISLLPMSPIAPNKNANAM